MKLNNRLVLLTAFVVLLATLSKVLFAPRLEFSGFSPIIAIALFSGMIMKERKQSFLFPLIALLISDGLIQLLYKAGWFQFEGFYRFQWVNYSLLLLSVLIGWRLKGQRYGRIIAGSLIASTLFFLFSNFSVWATHGGYQHPMTFDGLLLCISDGLPFYKNELIATLLYLPILIVAYNFLLKKRYSLKLV